MKKALADTESAIRLSDANPYSYYLRLRILRGFGVTEKMKDAFHESIAKYPGYNPLYDIVLGTLEPRWSGTIETMYAFVDKYAGHAAQYSPLKQLYLSLYRDLLSSASFACAINRDDKTKMAQCVASAMQQAVKPSLQDRVLTALQLYDHADKYQFGLALQSILSDMQRSSGGDAFAGFILQLASNAMHSDTQLKEDTPGHNDYAIDSAVSDSWYAKGFYDNALKKDLEALKDIEAMAFPSEEERDVAVARIYEDITFIFMIRAPTQGPISRSATTTVATPICSWVS